MEELQVADDLADVGRWARLRNRALVRKQASGQGQTIRLLKCQVFVGDLRLWPIGDHQVFRLRRLDSRHLRRPLGDLIPLQSHGYGG